MSRHCPRNQFPFHSSYKTSVSVTTLSTTTVHIDCRHLTVRVEPLYPCISLTSCVLNQIFFVTVLMVKDRVTLPHSKQYFREVAVSFTCLCSAAFFVGWGLTFKQVIVQHWNCELVSGLLKTSVEQVCLQHDHSSTVNIVILVKKKVRE